MLSTMVTRNGSLKWSGSAAHYFLMLNLSLLFPLLEMSAVHPLFLLFHESKLLALVSHFQYLYDNSGEDCFHGGESISPVPIRIANKSNAKQWKFQPSRDWIRRVQCTKKTDRQKSFRSQTRIQFRPGGLLPFALRQISQWKGIEGEEKKKSISICKINICTRVRRRKRQSFNNFLKLSEMEK